MHRVYGDFTYKSGSTTLNTKVTDLLRQRSGVCQDYAHFMVPGLRHLGLAGRYVSGYLATRTACWPSPADWRRRQPRMGGLLDAGRRLVLPRPNEQPAVRRFPRNGGLGTRLWRRRPGSWSDLHRGEEVHHEGQRRHGASRLSGRRAQPRATSKAASVARDRPTSDQGPVTARMASAAVGNFSSIRAHWANRDPGRRETRPGRECPVHGPASTP